MHRGLKRIMLVLLLGLLAASPAWAITLQQAAQRAAKNHNAKVLSARTVNSGNQRVHEIKLLTKKGVVKVVRIPEKSS